MGAVGMYVKKQEDDTMSDVIENMMTIQGNMNIEESMKDYVPITQTYFDVTKDCIVFCKSGISLDPREVGEAIEAYPRLSDEVITWLNAHNIPLNLEPGMYCLEQPGNKLRVLEY